MEEVKIEERSGVTIIRFQRNLKFSEVVDVIKNVALQDISSRRLWDVRAGFDFNADQIRQIATLGKSIWSDQARVAYLTDSELAYGLIRMFEAYRDQEGYLTHVFTHEDEAMDWLTAKDS
ncbi:MAG: hypothetical protein GKR91_10640 [Pseudomonadales bacterium]|nr:hypothetical protein [Pseudomonadales bacterium]